jgi:hypothetical protein
MKSRDKIQARIIALSKDHHGLNDIAYLESLIDIPPTELSAKMEIAFNTRNYRELQLAWWVWED